MSTPDPDGTAPLWNSIGGESVTPMLDEAYADHSLDRFDDSFVGDMASFDPSTESLADNSSDYADDVTGDE